MYAGSENGENNKPNQAPFTTTSVLCVHFRVKQQLINCTQGKRNYNRKSACKKKNVNNNACATTTETTNARNGTTTRRSLYPLCPTDATGSLSRSPSLACALLVVETKGKLRKTVKKKVADVAGCRLTPPTPSKASLLLRCYDTHRHRMFLAPCVSIERVRDSPPHRHALSFSPGCCCCCSPAGGALCTCALVPVSLPLSLCICALFAVPFCPVSPRVERSFLVFYFILFSKSLDPITWWLQHRHHHQQQQQRHGTAATTTATATATAASAANDGHLFCRFLTNQLNLRTRRRRVK